jgi:photosystem II stability/assembly factor-like uncharacterized protein
MDGIMIATDDGGRNWIKKDSSTSKHLYSIKFIGDKGFAVGTRGAFIVSNDSGATWKEMEKAINSKYWFMGITFSDDAQHGWIVGAHGTVVHTSNQGSSWEIISGTSITEE